MSIKIYNTTGLGFVLGEKISQDDDFVYLKYPGIFVQQMTQQGQPQSVIIEAVPPFFKGRDEMLKRFPLKKSMIIYGGQPEIKVVEAYEQYATQLQTRLTGIHVVGANTIPHKLINNNEKIIPFNK